MSHWSVLEWGRPRGRTRVAMLVAAVCALLSCLAQAGQVSFRWDYTASGAAGFIVYCGPSSGAFSMAVDVGNADASTLAGLAQDTVYRCAVTAYDATRSQSDYSNAVRLYVARSGRCVTGCDGDLNDDGVIDARDLDPIKQMWGKSDTGADLNGDGIVNVLDLAILRALMQ
jgi:hypothetical protein